MLEHSVSDCYKGQEMCNKAVYNYSHVFFLGCFMTKKMCDKAVNTYPSTVKSVPGCFMTHEMCDKAVNRCFSVFDSIPNWFKTQEMCDRVASEDQFLIVYCLGKYKTQRMYDEAVDDSLAELKIIPNWFVTSKIIKELSTALYTDENMLYFNEDSGNVVFSCNEMGILNIDLNNINLDHNFNEDYRDAIILTRFLTCYIKFENRKELEKKISE